MARVPTGKPRGRPKGCVKTGGRLPGGKSLDKSARQLVSSQLAGSIMTTFEGLGGTEAMLAWAADNQTVFYTQILSRLYPAAQRDDDGIQVNTQVNIGDSLSPAEAARRVAYALACGIYRDPSVAVRDVTPVEPTTSQRADWQPSVMPPLVQPEPVEDPARVRWIEELNLTPEARANAALIRETKEATLANYHGSTAEQGGTVRQPSREGKLTISEIRRRQLLS